jgi:hypothetical protein
MAPCELILMVELGRRGYTMRCGVEECRATRRSSVTLPPSPGSGKLRPSLSRDRFFRVALLFHDPAHSGQGIAELALARVLRLARFRLLFGQTVEDIQPLPRDRLCHNRSVVIAQSALDQLVKGRLSHLGVSLVRAVIV